MASYMINSAIIDIPDDADAMRKMLDAVSLLRHPLAQRIKLRPQPGCNSIGMGRGQRLIFPQSSERILSWSVEEAMGVILHEIAHMERRDIRVPVDEVWSIAADLVINSELRNEGIVLPDDVVYPENYGLDEGLSAEEYYELLKGEQS